MTLNATLKFSRGQTIYHEGDPATTLYKVETGFVRIAKLTPRGRVMTVRHILPNDYFAEDAFNKNQHDHHADALTDTQLISIDPEAILGQEYKVIKNLSDQLSRNMHYQYHLQIGDLRQRVARYLLELANTPLANNDQNQNPYVLATHELLAEGTFSTRESISKIIAELRQENLLHSGYRRITLLNMPALNEIAKLNDQEKTEAH